VIDQYESGIAACYDINQLEAMYIADEARKDVKQSTHVNCFRKAGFLSPRDSQGRVIASTVLAASSPTDIELEEALRLLNDNNNALVEAHIIPANAQMSLDYLCNPIEEVHPESAQLNDDEIIEIVNAQRKADNDIIIVDEEDGGTAPPSVTLAEAMSAMETLKLFVSDRRAGSLWRGLSYKLQEGMREIRKEMERAKEQRTLDDWFTPRN